MFFANEQRDNVREENPGISFGKHHPEALVTATDYRSYLSHSLS